MASWRMRGVGVGGGAGVGRRGCHPGIDSANVLIGRNMHVLKEVI